MVIKEEQAKRRWPNMNLDEKRLFLSLFGKSEEEIKGILGDEYELEALTQEYFQQYKDENPDV